MVRDLAEIGELIADEECIIESEAKIEEFGIFRERPAVRGRCFEGAF